MGSYKRFLQNDVVAHFYDNIKKYLYIVIFAVNDNGEGVMGFPIKCIYIDSNTGEILTEKAEHLDRPYSDRIPKSKTFFPQKDDKKKNSTSLFIEETTPPKELGVPYKQGGYYPPDTYRLYDGRAYNREEWAAYVKRQNWLVRWWLS